MYGTHLMGHLYDARTYFTLSSTESTLPYVWEGIHMMYRTHVMYGTHVMFGYM